MTQFSYTITSTTGVAHNGPICQTCRARYVGTHECSVESLLEIAEFYQDLARRRFDELMAAGTPVELDVRLRGRRTAGCPCRTENGGSGVCGCTLGGPQVTC